MDSFIELIETLTNQNEPLESCRQKISEYFNNTADRQFDELYGLLQNPLKSWVESVLTDEPVPDEVLGLFFGLYERSDGFVLYLCGSEKSQENEDWPCNPSYWPEGRYFKNDFLNRYNSYLEETNIEPWEFCLFLIMYTLKEYIFLHSTELDRLNGGRKLFMGCGFDDGDFFLIRGKESF